MYKFNEYVNASDIWPTANSHIDKGEKQGLVRGYNIEIKKHDGTTYWESCCWFDGTPEQYYNSDYYLWHFEDSCGEPTGRICFRGYGEEYYDPTERDYFIKPVKDEDVDKIEEMNNIINNYYSNNKEKIIESIKSFFPRNVLI